MLYPGLVLSRWLITVNITDNQVAGFAFVMCLCSTVNIAVYTTEWGEEKMPQLIWISHGGDLFLCPQLFMYACMPVV
jgi:hypothetical protein